MGLFFIVGRSLSVKGGSIHMKDVNLYRSAANVMKSDDALTVAGTVTASLALDASGGTVLKVPYHTVSPNVDANGHLTFLQKGNRSYLLYHMGGTPCYITMPQVTAGTMLVTVAGTP